MHKLYKINDSIYPYRFIFYFITFIVFTPQILSYTLTSKFKTYYKAYYRLTTLHIHQPPHHNLLRTSNNIIHLSPIASDFPPSTSPSHLVSPSSVPQAYPSSHSIPHQYHADIHSTFLQATASYNIHV